VLLSSSGKCLLLYWMFQSSPDPKAGCYGWYEHQSPRPGEFQSSPDPKAGCYLIGAIGSSYSRLVSILTRPEGRVLQRYYDAMTKILEFQSSPDPKAGCYLLVQGLIVQPDSFNPHPTRRPGATADLRGYPAYLLRFNPHPTRRPGATTDLP